MAKMCASPRFRSRYNLYALYTYVQYKSRRPVMQNKTNLVLDQKITPHEQCHFELKAGRELHVVHTRQDKTTKYAFSILAMHAQGKRIYQFKKRWLLLALGTLLVMPLFPQILLHLPAGIEHYSLSILLVLFFTAMLFFMLLVRSFKNRYVFYSAHTRLPLVEFWVNNPTRKEFQQFIAALEDGIRLHRQEMNIAYDKQLAGELRTLRRVTEAGILSESVYLAAKAKLLIMSDVNYRPSGRKS